MTLLRCAQVFGLPYDTGDRKCGRFLGRGCDEALLVKTKGFFSEQRGGNSVKEGFGKDFHRKGNSVKRSMPFTELPDSEN